MYGMGGVVELGVSVLGVLKSLVVRERERELECGSVGM